MGRECVCLSFCMCSMWDQTNNLSKLLYDCEIMLLNDRVLSPYLLLSLIPITSIDLLASKVFNLHIPPLHPCLSLNLLCSPCCLFETKRGCCMHIVFSMKLQCSKHWYRPSLAELAWYWIMYELDNLWFSSVLSPTLPTTIFVTPCIDIITCAWGQYRKRNLIIYYHNLHFLS